MREYISPDREANAIRLRRETFAGVFVLVEGSSDKIFYENFTDNETCQVVTVSGKPSSKERAIAILEILEKDNFQGILAIVDADFDRLETPAPNSPNLLRTDTHDLETMILQSPALEKVTIEFGSEDKIRIFPHDIRSILLEAGTLIGYLRWISLKDGLQLTFEGIKFSDFIERLTLITDEIKLIQAIINKSQRQSLQQELHQKLTERKSDRHDRWQICCGHDLVEILSLGLQKAIGTCQPTEVKPEALERSLRLAYEREYFRETQLFLEIRVWENNHQPFRVLPDAERS